MLYAILSDVHANPDAFRNALADARRQGAKKIICLGDLVGYGPAAAASRGRLLALTPLLVKTCVGTLPAA